MAMVSFAGFRSEEGVPLYRQIERYVKLEAALGSIADGDELPSRRMLSALLGINPNTVQKAYRQLEEEGLIRSHGGAGSVLVLDDASIDRLRRELIADRLDEMIAFMKRLGFTQQDGIDFLRACWNSAEIHRRTEQE